jgi:hypothetical protein
MRHTSLGGRRCIALYLFVVGVGRSQITPTYTITISVRSAVGKHTDGHQQSRRHRRLRGNGRRTHARLPVDRRIPVDLGTLGGEDSFAYRVNDRGIIVGRAQDSTGVFTLL